MVNCPICKGELEQGRLRYGNSPGYFLPDNERPIRWFTRKNFKKKRALRLGPMKDGWPIAYCCRECKVIIAYGLEADEVEFW